jgi:predicted nucleotidyltransferase
MLPLISERRPEIAGLCRRFGVRRLDVFGSAARESGFDASRSDLDFVVEFEPQEPVLAYRSYFGLKEALERLLGRPVDLLTEGVIRNPYLRASVEEGRRLLYAA